MKYPTLTDEQFEDVKNILDPDYKEDVDIDYFPLSIAGVLGFVDLLKGFSLGKLLDCQLYWTGSHIPEEEIDHPFNLRSAYLNAYEHDFWLKHDSLTIDEFTAIVMSRKPEAISLSKAMDDTSRCTTSNRFIKIYNLLKRAQETGSIDEDPSPKELAHWARSKKLTDSTLLIKTAEKR